MASGSKILIVDDETEVGTLFSRILTHAGYEVRSAQSAEEGLRTAEEYQPDMIIVDFRMPMINGVGFLYRLRERSGLKDVPVVMVTGHGALSDEVMADLKLLGADVHYKPVGQQDLLTITRAILLR